jgi:5-methylcytosine-specific restriction protein A
VLGGRCAAHARSLQRTRIEGSPSQRGRYDRAWQRFRARILSERPACEDCLDVDLISRATEVHHVEKLVDAPHRRLDDTNTRALCKSCHSTRTRRGE